MEPNATTNTNSAEQTAIETEATSTEQTPLNAFQQFLAGLMGGEKAKAEDGTPADTKPASKAAPPAGKSFTADEVAEMLKAEKVKTLQEEANKANLDKLTPEERHKAELEAKDKELAELKEQQLRSRLKSEAVSLLNKDGFPVALADILLYDTKENMEKSLAQVAEVFKSCLADAVNTKLKGKTPAGLGGAANTENSMVDEIGKRIRGGM